MWEVFLRFVWNVQVEKRGKGWYVEETNFNFPRDFNSRLCLIHQLLTSIYFKGVHSCFFFKFNTTSIYFKGVHSCLFFKSNTTMNLFCLKITFSYKCVIMKNLLEEWQTFSATLSPQTVSSVQLPATESCENQQSLQTSQTNPDPFLSKPTQIIFCQNQPRYFLFQLSNSYPSLSKVIKIFFCQN